jgi:hypothetical protein
MTVESLVRQTYRRDLCEVLIAIEARDPDIRPEADRAVRSLQAAVETEVRAVTPFSHAT